jgi:tRNA dimethylallyltransferase
MAGVPHFMLDVVNPKNRFTVVEYVKRAQKNLKEIFLRKHTPIVCGGTGFYISALVDEIVFPDVPPNLKLREKLAKLSGEKLIAILKKLDPKRTEGIDQKNLRRVIRAIEIATALGKVPKLDMAGNQNYDCLFIGTEIDSKKLRQKIHVRLLSRIKDGMIKEAIDLHKKRLSWKRMEELGLEYRYLARFLQNKITKEKMLSELETEIWHYARRQMTWFKRDKRIVWISPKKISDINKLIKNFLS